VSDAPADDDLLPTEPIYRIALLQELKQLSPAGFERICKRLLLEVGFQEVEVTGRPADGGIDGHGNASNKPAHKFLGGLSMQKIRDPFRQDRFKVFAVQCTVERTKEYSLRLVHLLRRLVKKRRDRDTVPIELVDGEKLIDMSWNTIWASRRRLKLI